MLPTSTTRSTGRDYARPAMPAVLYAIPASHPCAAVERALQLKELPYRRVELIPVAHRLLAAAALRRGVGAAAWRSTTASGRRLARDPAGARGARARAAAAAGRRDARAGVGARRGVGRPGAPAAGAAARVGGGRARDRARSMSYTDGARLPIPAPAARLSAPLVARMARRLNGATDPAVRADLHRAPVAPRPGRPLDRGRHAGRRARSTPPISRSARACGCCSRWRTWRRRSTHGRRARWRGACSRRIRATCPQVRCPRRGWRGWRTAGAEREHGVPPRSRGPRPSPPARSPATSTSRERRSSPAAPLRPHPQRRRGGPREPLAVPHGDVERHPHPAALPHRAPRRRREPDPDAARRARARAADPRHRRRGPARRAARSAATSVTTPGAAADGARRRRPAASATRPLRSTVALAGEHAHAGERLRAARRSRRRRRAGSGDGQRDVVEVRVGVACRSPGRPQRHLDRARQRRDRVRAASAAAASWRSRAPPRRACRARPR